MPRPHEGALTASRWGKQVYLILRKDLVIEARTGEVVPMTTFFALLVVVLASFSFYGGAGTRQLVAAGAVWLAMAFAAVLGLGRSWLREREDSALDALLVMPLSRSALFVGKALGTLGFLSIVFAVILPAASVLFSIPVAEVGLGLLLVGALALPGIAASGTLFGAMIVRTNARDLALSVVLFPLLSPALLAAVSATRELLDGAAIADLVGHLVLLGCFDGLFALGGVLLLGPLLEP